MTSTRRRSGQGPHERSSGPGNDLRALDPGRLDDTYWARFRLRVMTLAADELARRRAASEITILDVAQGWARVLGPAAAVAAALGAVLIYQGSSRRVLAVDGPEEVLIQELEDRTLPDFMALPDADDGAFLLSGGIY